MIKMKNDEKLSSVLELLSELERDSTIPKNVKSTINKILTILKDNSENSIKIDKVMHMFDELNEDPNIDPFTRTQLWNVISMLEAL